MEEVIDHALPLIKVRAFVKAIEQELLRNDFLAARETSLNMIVEVRALSLIIRHMQQQEEALTQARDKNAVQEQTETV